MKTILKELPKLNNYPDDIIESCKMYYLDKINDNFVKLSRTR